MSWVAFGYRRFAATPEGAAQQMVAFFGNEGHIPLVSLKTRLVGVPDSVPDEQVTCVVPANVPCAPAAVLVVVDGPTRKTPS